MQLSSGKRLGPYEVVAPLGSGGMGQVWRARDTRLGRSVAVKVLPSEYSDSAEVRERFEREARAISQLSHPHICTLYDIGHECGVSYLVMELLEGETLADRIARGPVPLPEVLKMGMEIAEGLDKAHRHGIIHRDLKPGNVMITRTGAKLLDFGLAKSSAAQLSMPEEATLVQDRKPLTAEGMIVGTLQYMAPEQLAGTVDHRTDIFALGVVLYEATTGRRAFEGTSRRSLVTAIIGSSPRPIAELQPLAPPAFEHVINKCLEKEPDDRWQSAHDVAEELKWISVAGSQAGIAAPLAIRRRARARIAWAAAAVSLAVIASVVAFRFGKTFREPVAFSFDVPATTSAYEGATPAVISPDGRRLAFIASRPGGERLVWVRPIDSIEAIPLAGTEGVVRGTGASLTWSDDSRSVFFYKGAKAYRIPATGGVSQQVSSFATPFGLTSNKQGTVLFGPGNGVINQIDPRGTPHEIGKLQPSEVLHVWPSFLPDGKHYLFLKGFRPYHPSYLAQLYARSIDGKEPEKYLGEVASRVEYAEPGYLLNARDGALWAIPFDLDRLKITGAPISVVDNVAFQQWTGAADFSVSRDGTLVVGTPSFVVRPHIVTREGAVLQVAPVNANIRHPGRLLSDDKTYVFGQTDLKFGTSDIWTMDILRGTLKRVTFGPENEGESVPSRDGKRVYYSSDRLGWPDIWWKEMDSPKESLLIQAPLYQTPLDISPDGRYLLYMTNQNASSWDLYVARIDVQPAATAPFVQTPASEGDTARFSPDGRWVIYTSWVTGKEETYVKPFPGPGPEQQVSNAGGAACRWSAAGDRIYYVQQNKLFSTDFNPSTGHVGEPRLEFAIPGELWTWEPRKDGTFLMFFSDWSKAPPTRVYTNWTRLLKH